MKTRTCAALGAATFLLIVTACGGGGGDGRSFVSPTIHEPIAAHPVTMHGAIAVSHGTRQDGVTGATLAGFLTHHRRTDSPFGEGTLWGSTPPVVRVASARATPQYVEEVRRAVEIINSALPPDWQMTFDPTLRQENFPFGHGTEWYDGEIVVNYAPSENRGRHGGFARAKYGKNEDGATVVTASRLSISTDHGGSPRHRLSLVIHEIGHTLGIGGDSWANISKIYPDSIMTYSQGEQLQPNGDDIVYPLDRDSFLALYGVLEPGMDPEEVFQELGDWADTTAHVRGDLELPDGEVSFGVSGRNGFNDAWATGTDPQVNITDNASLSGSVAWTGRMLGMDDASKVVGGSARLSVDISTLDGDLTFADLEAWSTGQPPGAIGTGTSWGDGDLAYSIVVRGNTFVRTGGDVGTIRGEFFGASHEGMGGTLERDDLTAGFGGKQ